MHARQLVELAALVAHHGPLLARSGEPICQASARRYWTASKSRLDRWGWTLKKLSISGPGTGPAASPGRRHLVRGTIEEILTGEILTRIWTAVTCAHDRHHGTDQAEPLARSVLAGHLEARHRVLTLLVQGPGIGAEQAIKLNHLRRRAERWTDLLIGYLAGLCDVSGLAVDPRRAEDFAEDIHHESRQPGGRRAWPLVVASLRASFAQTLAPISPNADLNAAIAEGILGCFPAELFESTGVFHSAWLSRLSRTADDVQEMIRQLLTSRPTPSGRP